MTDTANFKTLVDTEITAAHTSGALKERLKGIFAEEENSQRVDLLVKGFKKLWELEKMAAQKANPDQVNYDTAGTEMKTFSKGAFEAKKKAEEELGKWKNAVSSAFEKADFAALKKLLGNTPA